MNMRLVVFSTTLLATFFLLTRTAQADLIISEVLPYPESGDEFVELFNGGPDPVDLTNWAIDDDLGGGRSPKSISGTINPNNYLVLYFSNNFPYFNNTGGDSVNLLDPSSQLINSVSYQNPVKNLSYSLVSGVWEWSDPTPNASNQTSETTTQTTTQQQNQPSQPVQQTNSASGGEQPDQLNGLFLNEALPDPVGSDAELEFIEIYNSNGYQIDLGGWKLDDASGGSGSYLIQKGTIIGPLELLVFYSEDTKISLNNTGGDSVRLIRPDGSLADGTVYYDKAEEGVAFAKTKDGLWAWTQTPTPKQSNVFETATKTSITQTAQETNFTAQAQETAISQETIISSEQPKSKTPGYDQKINIVTPTSNDDPDSIFPKDVQKTDGLVAGASLQPTKSPAPFIDFWSAVLISASVAALAVILRSSFNKK